MATAATTLAIMAIRYPCISKDYAQFQAWR
jgi:hypothetical protein